MLWWSLQQQQQQQQQATAATVCCRGVCNCSNMIQQTPNRQQAAGSRHQAGSMQQSSSNSRSNRTRNSPAEAPVLFLLFLTNSFLDPEQCEIDSVLMMWAATAASVCCCGGVCECSSSGWNWWSCKVFIFSSSCHFLFCFGSDWNLWSCRVCSFFAPLLRFAVFHKLPFLTGSYCPPWDFGEGVAGSFGAADQKRQRWIYL